MLEQNNTKVNFQIQRVYDTSFEISNTPRILQKDCQTKVRFDLETSYNILTKGDVYKIVLSIVITALLDKETTFLCKMQQPDIFSIYRINNNQIAHYLGKYYLNALLSYARECTANLIFCLDIFLNLNLALINFNALFVNYLQTKKYFIT